MLQGLLAPFSAAASRDDKLRCMFAVYDVDGGLQHWARMELHACRLVFGRIRASCWLCWTA
jgi:hypothetical protein